MRKILSKFLVSIFIVGIFLLPLSLQFQTKEGETSINLKDAKVYADGPWHFVSHSQSFSPTGSVILTVAFTSEDFTDLNACKTAQQAYAAAHTGEVVGQCTGPEGDGLASSTLVSVYDENGAKVNPKGGDGIYFGCTVNPLTWFTNCILATLYYLIFTPLAAITAITADILDYFIYYSTSDQAYRNTFIEKGWGVVRDIANIFFIIGLMFVAIKTVLGINTTNNRKMISSIIIFALVINFSLFATKVVVDASNVLAKIFYHQIKPIDKNGVPIESKQEQRSVTVGLVKIFDPINVINAPTCSGSFLGLGCKSGEKDVSEMKSEFFLVLLLAIILMAYMIYIFISVSFLFVARTASIWLAMIFSPFAFASHAISTHIKGLGWDEWLSNLLKSAFLAPLFIFFLYIILLFGDIFALGGVSVSGSEEKWISGFMSTFIPFMIVFVLISQAKSLAKTYSGAMGDAISKGAVAAIGLAAGGAALTTAFVGRQTVGRTLARASRGDTLSQKYNMDPSSIKSNFLGTGWNYKKSLGWAGNKLGLHKAYGNTFDIQTKQIGSGIGGVINKSQKKVSDVVHTQKKWSDLKDKAHITTPDGNLSGPQIAELEKQYKKDNRSDLETQIKRGDKDVYLPGKNGTLEGGVDVLGNRAVYKNEAEFKRDETARLKVIYPTASEKEIELKVNTLFSTAMKESFEKVSTQKFSKLNEDSKKTAGMGSSLISRTTGDSYDIRDLIKAKAGKKEGLGFKATALLISSIAGAVRLGMKKGVGAESGKASGDFKKDIASLIKDSLSGLKIDLSTGGGHGGGKDDHSKMGGGGHGGGDHH